MTCVYVGRGDTRPYNRQKEDFTTPFLPSYYLAPAPMQAIVLSQTVGPREHSAARGLIKEVCHQRPAPSPVLFLNLLRPFLPQSLSLYRSSPVLCISSSPPYPSTWSIQRYIFCRPLTFSRRVSHPPHSYAPFSLPCPPAPRIFKAHLERMGEHE